MPRWKELPPELPEKDRRLLVQLRRLKDRSGLGLAGLAAKTGYSRSSWERYLNGKQPVPRAAVEELAKVCGTDPTRLLVLHELTLELGADGQGAPGAEETDGVNGVEGSQRAEGAAGVEGGDAGHEADRAGAPGPAAGTTAPRASVPLRYAIPGGVLAVAVAFTAGLLLAPDRDPDAKGSGADAQAGAQSYAPGHTYPCSDSTKDGLAYAGHSVTRENLVALNGSGPDVVEIQCLLRKHGYDPGAVDGLYGVSARDAVKRFQKARGLVDDGMVGPDTWGELRR
ncbi:peptidoglycan-binding protein [Streptomyces acidicola]|uniref:peptidoglycan-binding protein n=1 Tax=Streptomyces acidicola TaxID=2596892 RepID=UPI00379F2B6E